MDTEENEGVTRMNLLQLNPLPNRELVRAHSALPDIQMASSSNPRFNHQTPGLKPRPRRKCEISLDLSKPVVRATYMQNLLGIGIPKIEEEKI